jgi:hypothetical protein
MRGRPQSGVAGRVALGEIGPGEGIILAGVLDYRFGRGMGITLPDGERWKAAGLPWSARKLVGRKVVAHGVCVGFRTIDVVEIEAAD